MMNAQSFSATPTPAEAMTPSELTMAKITRKEMLTSSSCSAMGAPSRSIRRILVRSKRTSLRANGKGSPRLFVTSRQSTTLTAWASTVAKAAPATPMPKPATKSRSPTMLTTQATDTVKSGVFESPIPRNTPPITL